MRTSRTTTTTGTGTTSTTSKTTCEPGPGLAIGLGSNLASPHLGSSPAVLRWALGELDERYGPLAVAPLYRSVPLSAIPQEDFYNSVVLAALPDAGDPHAILDVLKDLERQAGRRPGARWGPRVLDLDLLLYGELCFDDGALTLPHPRLRERRFVLAPLADLAGDLRLPPDGMRVRDALARLGEDQAVERLDEELC